MPFSSRTRTTALTSLPPGPCAVAVLDVDGFDLVNDRDGFEAGDAVLAAVEDALLAGLPGGASLHHVKGDEWLVAMTDAAPEELLVVLDGIRRGIAAEDGPVTLSGGVAARPQHGSTLEDLLVAADGAATRAKDAGGNRIAIAAEAKMVLKSSYYPRAALRRLAKLAERTQRTEASHLRDALDAHLAAHAELL
ncbi:MAG TPA: GGDEF domain-containing protein [Acidimicrobiales bacterium]|nr:GGDEF domain-containing protein [Acidimicrobiales bacterium]